jgi:hypothetical protein
VQIEHVAVVVHRLALTPTVSLGWEGTTVLQVWAVEALLLGMGCDVTTNCVVANFTFSFDSFNVFQLLFVYIVTYAVYVWV